MTDRTNLDVAADAAGYGFRTRMKVGLDAIHPALAHLTPDDVAAVFSFVNFNDAGEPELDHFRQVLSRD